MSTEIQAFDPDKFSLRKKHDGFYPFIIDFSVVTREEWGAKPPQAAGEALTRQASTVVATLHTGTPECTDELQCEHTVREIQWRHLQQGYDDIQYNFLIGTDGRVYEGRGWYCRSCPRLGTPVDFPEGEERLDIAFIGDWRYQENPSTSMIDPSMFLLLFGVKKDLIKDRYKFFELDKRYEPPSPATQSP